jgi:hypothetical protein
MSDRIYGGIQSLVRFGVQLVRLIQWLKLLLRVSR